jgi:hypothetical protein
VVGCVDAAGEFFHIAIAIVAVAVLSKLRPFFYTAIAAGLIGVFFLGHGWLLHVRGPHEAHGGAAAHQAPPSAGAQARPAPSDARALPAGRSEPPAGHE